MTLNTAIKSWQIQPATISGGHLVVSNSVSGTQILSYDANEDSFKWDYLATVTINEVPSGDIDGSNKEFTLANTPLEDSERVYLNGLLQEPGSGKDYTIDGNKITFTTAPESGDVVLVSYLIEKSNVHTNVPYGYISGGDNSGIRSSTDRITFPFDSGIATVVGVLSKSVTRNAGVNSSSCGYSIGGRDNTNNATTNVQRFSFPFDSGTATLVGNLSLTYAHGAGVNSSAHGFTLGGDNSNVNRFQFPFDSGIASNVGNLSDNIAFINGGANNSTYGYSLGGYISSVVSIIDRIQFPFDSGTASHVGNLSQARSNVFGFNSSMHGYTCGGAVWPNLRSTIDRFQFPFDSGTSTHVGNLSHNIKAGGGVNSTMHGFMMGGEITNRVSFVHRLEFPFDSGTAETTGNLSASKRLGAPIDGTDFVSMFV